MAPRRRRTLNLMWPVALLVALWSSPVHAAFDHRHSAWDGLLAQRVVVAPGGNESTLRCSGVQAHHDALQACLAALSAVTDDAGVRSMTRDERRDRLA